MMNCYYLKYLLFNWSTPTTPVSTQSPSIPSSPLPCSPQACHVSFWSRWSPCTHQCGTNGTQTRTRTKTIFESCGGSCPHLSEIRSCNRDNCQNSGTPSRNGCSCPPGYVGTCCEIGKLKKKNPQAKHTQNLFTHVHRCLYYGVCKGRFKCIVVGLCLCHVLLLNFNSRFSCFTNAVLYISLYSKAVLARKEFLVSV